MAGSRKDMVYTANDGKRYAVNIDESNGEAADFDDYGILDLVAGVPLPYLPRGFKMRSGTVSRNGTNRKIWIGKPDSALILGTAFSILLPQYEAGAFAVSVAWDLISLAGEVLGRRPRTEDTGLLDGDAS